MVLRMLRVAMPAPGEPADGIDGVRDGQALALLQAVGGFQAFRRAVPAPPNAGPVARFLLYERAYPDSVAASVDAVHGALVDADEAPRSSEPVLRLSRLAPTSSSAAAPPPRMATWLRPAPLRPERAGARRRRHRRALLRRRGRRNRDRARMNYDIHYLTTYRYETPVTDNLNALRVRPATTSSQRCDEFHVRLDPEARIQRHVDYFGTEVMEFGVARPHDHMTIDVRARVVTCEPRRGARGAVGAPRRRHLRRGRRRVPARRPTTSPPTPCWPSCSTSPARARRWRRVRWLNELIPDRFAYRPGVTYVGSTVEDLLDAGAGVCQDFVHLALVLLRRNGIAARYVSGYLFSAPEDGGSASVEVQTHAWLEALLPGTGGRGEPIWVGADPTNRRLAGETHVKIGHGRRYGDVPPIKGVYRGTARAELRPPCT